VTAPAYLIQGDSLFIQEKSAFYIGKAGEPDRVSTETVSLASAELGDVLSKALNQPFFSDLQIFIFQDAVELNQKDLDLLENYLKEPAKFSVLFFLWNEDGKDAYAKPSEIAKRLAEIIRNAHGGVETASPQGAASAVQSFIRIKLKNAGKTASSQALKNLEQLGQDFPSLLDTAVENLILAAGSSPEITPEMVEAFDEDRGRGNRFKFLDALLARRTDDALRLFARLLDSGEDDPMMLMAFLHGQFRLYWQAQLLAGRGLPDSRIFSEIKLNPKRAVFFARQMRSFNCTQLESALESLFEIDRAVKVGEEEIRTGLEKWIARTAGFRSAVRAI